MRTLVATMLAVASCATLRADFTYQDTTSITGGAVYTMLRALGPFTRGAREPIVTTNVIKGNRMATIAKDRITIIDLDKESITEIDVPKKTYSVLTFAQMKQAMEDAMARAQQEQAKQEKAKQEKSKQAPDTSNVEAKFKVSAKATGQSKTVGVLEAKETLITMTLEATDKDSGQTGAMNITVDSWLATVPGYDEVKEFHRKMGEKLGYAFGSGLAQTAMMTRPEALQGFAEAAKELNKVSGTPVQSVTKIGGSGDPSTAGSTTSSQSQQQQNSQGAAGTAAGAAIGRLAGGLGGFGRKKNNDQPKQQDQPKDDQSSGTLVETTTELTSFSSGPADASKLEVPAGYKQVENDVTKRRR